MDSSSSSSSSSSDSSSSSSSSSAASSSNTSEASKYKLGSSALISQLFASPSKSNSLISKPVAGALLIPQHECPDAKYKFVTLVSPIRGPEEDGTSKTGK
ncbi:hypothetical protein OGAPHI_000986 [Ogataea philodendri]|uniref:Uncharacterized protein n=1 Tax=Ogataea philodendri TaxID=1378263 RepID=A0A9P8T940_9ASCO|nr:uncharacterized protein OGAPHI_000986 [Ogataea philodendri]KAH3670471.1 hypothetical protein OGAPHI_000986 [Ogataea philodendri]